MKQLALFLFVLTFTACTKDDVTPSFSASDLTGTWNLVSVSCNDGMTTTEGFGSKTSATFVQSSKDHNAKTVFEQNPNTYVSTGSYTAINIITAPGVNSTQEATLQDFKQSGTWKLEGNMLVIKNPGEPEQRGEIIRLDTKNFEYKTFINDTSEFQGFTIKTTATFIFKMTR